MPQTEKRGVAGAKLIAGCFVPVGQLRPVLNRLWRVDRFGMNPWPALLPPPAGLRVRGFSKGHKLCGGSTASSVVTLPSAAAVGVDAVSGLMTGGEARRK